MRRQTQPANGSPYILWFGQCGRDQAARVGGKNAGLGEMVQAGMCVPPGFAITTDAYAEYLRHAGCDRRIERLLAGLEPDDLPALEQASQAIRQMLGEAEIPPAVEHAVHDAYERLASECGVEDLPVAVRSSATAEDLPDASFAGQQDTTLWVRSAPLVMIRTAICWSSLFTPRAIAYRRQMGFAHEAVLISVGIQKMVNARTAGVMFSLNPANGDRSTVAIEASWGLGETVVAGMVTPDNFLVDKISRAIVRRTASPKLLEYVPDPVGRRAEIRAVPPERQTCLCLSDGEVLELADLAIRIERHYGRPMDIEWAIDADLPFPANVMTLQTRPETVWSRQAPRRVLGTPLPGALDYVVANLLTGVRTGKPRP
jgi:pyruvate,water dikinase